MKFADFMTSPQKNKEGWRATDLTPWKDVSFAQADGTIATPLGPQTINGPCLVFVDGIWRKDLSDLLGLDDNLITGDNDQGYTLTFAGKTCLIASPLVVRHISTPQTTATEASTKLKIVLGGNCRLTLVELFDAPPQTVPYVRLHETEIIMDGQSKLVHGVIVHEPHLHLANTNVKLDAGAFYDATALIINGVQSRAAYTIAMDAPMAQANVQTALLLRHASKADLDIDMRHNVPQGISHQYVKAVLDDKAQGAFQGRIFVAKDAQQTDGNQQSRALLLSDQASMSAKPALEINADDVKCAHGSAIGALDDEAVFYLRSRGLSEKEARQLLIEAFVNELADKVSNPEIKAALLTEIGVWLHG